MFMVGTDAMEDRIYIVRGDGDRIARKVSLCWMAGAGLSGANVWCTESRVSLEPGRGSVAYPDARTRKLICEAIQHDM